MIVGDEQQDIWPSLQDLFSDVFECLINLFSIIFADCIWKIDHHRSVTDGMKGDNLGHDRLNLLRRI